MATSSDSRDQGDVLFERRGPVVYLILSRPRYLNAMTWHMYERLSEHLETLQHDDAARVVVLSGAGGRALASGTDIHQFEGFDGAQGVAYEHRIDAIVSRMALLPKPTIAAIEGYAVGGGMALAAACDLRYANASAQIGIPVARSLGNCLALSTYRRLASILGVSKVKELVYTARLMTSEESLHSGFLTDVFRDDEFHQRVAAIADEIAGHAPLTIWATKEAFIRQEEWARSHIDQEVPFADVVERVYDSHDFHQAVVARLNKEPPTWSGR